MEEIALGEMQMTEAELHQITPRSLFNKLHGFRANEMMAWERMRIQTWWLLRPHDSENSLPAPQQLFPLPGDVDVIQTQKERAKEVRERSKALWAKIDEGKKNNTQ